MAEENVREMREEELLREELMELEQRETETDQQDRGDQDLEMEKRCCCSQKEKKRTGKEERDLLNRLSRIEGQIRGIKAMVEDDRYCVDILTQVSAVQAALNSFNKMLLSNHIKTCVVEDIERGNTEVVDELCRTIQKLMK